jgi:hypothetical protein
MTFSFANAGTLDLNIPIQLPEERSTNRETVNILPAHPTPIWEEGQEGHGEDAAHGEDASHGGNVEGEPVATTPASGPTASSPAAGSPSTAESHSG